MIPQSLSADETVAHLRSQFVPISGEFVQGPVDVTLSS